MLRADQLPDESSPPVTYRREPSWVVWLVLVVAFLGALVALGGRMLDAYTRSKDAQVTQLERENSSLEVQVAAARLGQDCTLDYIEQIAQAVPTLRLPPTRPATCPPPLTAKERATLEAELRAAGQGLPVPSGP